MILEIDTLINPEDESIPQRQADLADDILQRMIPPTLVGKNNQLDQIRSNYVDNKIALQLESLPVNDATTSLEFWQYVTTMQTRYQRKTTPAPDATESI